MPTKSEFTTLVLNKLPSDHGLAHQQALTTWWQDPRPDSGLRLNDLGLQAFVTAGMPAYEFALPAYQASKPRYLITLNKKLQEPYYLSLGKKSWLTLFGSKEATLYSLYGNIDRFISALYDLG